MPKKITAADALERGLMEPDEGAELEAEAAAEETAASTEQIAAETVPAQEQAATTATEERATEQTTEEHPSRANERIRELVAERKAAEAEREAARREAQELRERWARLDERRNQAAEAASRFDADREAAERQAQRPDPAIDPQGAELFDIRQAREQDRRELEELKRQVAQGTQQTAATLEQQQMLNFLRDDVGRFEREHPDYSQAAAFAAERRKEFWMRLGHNEDNARAIVERETAAIVNSGVLNNKSVAQTVWNLATEWGYQTANGNGTAAPAGQQAPVNGGVTSQEKLRQVAAGQKVQGMPKTGAAAGEPDEISRMSAAQIAAMDEDLFLRITSTPSGARAMNQRMRDLELG